MRQRDLNFFRRLLEDRRSEILEEAERALGTLNTKAQEACADPSDRASLESDRAFLLRMRDRERKLLSKIDEAFARIDGGIYGQCEECGGQIGIVRVDNVVAAVADPFDVRSAEIGRGPHAQHFRLESKGEAQGAQGRDLEEDNYTRGVSAVNVYVVGLMPMYVRDF